MSNIVDFNKAKKEVEQKKSRKSSITAKNQRLAQKQKRYDSGKKFKPYHFYIALFACIAIVYLLINLIK